jgi:hypothetical protein
MCLPGQVTAAFHADGSWPSIQAETLREGQISDYEA